MRKSFKKVLSLLLALLLAASVLLSLTGCSAQAEYRDYTFFEMDTYIVLRLARSAGAFGYLSDEYLDSVANECDRIIASCESYLSCHNDSQLSAINTEIAMMLNTDEKLLSAIATADRLSDITDGAFDYTLGALSTLWNVSGGGPVPGEDMIAEALLHTGRDKFEIDGSTVRKADKLAMIDLGGIGKGMATQTVLEYLSETDIEYAIVSLGGNIGVYGNKPEYGSYKIGVRDPDESTEVIGYWFISNGFVSVSGDYERFFEEGGKRYHHILDPKTGCPADSGIRSVAVHSSNGAAADALSTALFVMGYEKAMELYDSDVIDFEAIFVTVDGSVVTTPGVGDDFLFTSDNFTFTEK